MSRRLIGLLVVPLAIAVASCAPQSSSNNNSSSSGGSSSTSSCTPGSLPLQHSGQLSVATDSPAYPPWFINNDPSNGKGYESAVAYAVAKQLGFTNDQVVWSKERFNSSYKPGPKDFDFYLAQVSITPAREKTVDFSDPYYKAAQGVIVRKNTPIAGATSIADLAKYKLGAQTGTTSLTAIRDVIKPTQAPLVFQDTNAATHALENGQVDGILADVPTAYIIVSAEMSDGKLLGQFQPETGQQEEFGMVFEKGSGLVPCVNKALTTIKSDGTLAALDKKWLSNVTHVPTLK